MQYLVTGHDKALALFHLSNMERVWEKKPESIRKTGTQDQIRVFVDPSASIVVASSTDKSVSIYECGSGNLISRVTCGEITTAMCLSTNLKHLITASAEGIIYIWRLPEPLTKALVKVRNDNRAKEVLEAQTIKEEEEVFDFLEQEGDKKGEEFQMKKKDRQNEMADIMS